MRSFLLRGTAAIAIVAGAVAISDQVAAKATGRGVGATAGKASCPWVTPPAGASPSALAAQVLAHMTPAEKFDVISLASEKAYENATIAVPSLCIPSLTMQDGPDGLAYGDTGVTQFPAALALAATFDPELAYAEGQALGAQAKAQGVDAVQGPYLNLARVPEAGRVFEGYGEDPLLSGAIGAADVEGIQSDGVLVDLKDLGVYTQEADRDFLDQTVSTRALEELYFAPFREVVAAADPASMMCGFGSINGVQTCEDPRVFSAMRAAGFTGFFRDDINAAPNGGEALTAGLDLFKPSLESTSRSGPISSSAAETAIDGAVTRVLTEMFRFGLIQHPRTGTTSTAVQTSAEEAAGLEVAERSGVLLKNSDGVLPIAASVHSIAVIGAPAAASPLASGGGSSHVAVTTTITPLEAIKAQWPRASVLVAVGEPAASPATEISPAQVSPLLPTVPPPARHPIYNVNRPPSGTWKTWSGTLRPTRSGWYRISVVSHGDTELGIDGKELLDDSGTHGPVIDQLAYDFSAGKHYPMTLRWFEYDGDVPKISWRDVSPMLRAAAAAASKAQIAVVFAGNESTEGADNASLSLNGVQDELIEAVAKANRRTVVVLNTGGPVLMPWISSVSAVLEDWYPGQDDGAAIVSLLSGETDPSGRLPVTFPISQYSTSITSSAQWPGTNGVVNLNDADGGLDIGYRYYEAHHVAVLFPFGAGLAYTTFALTGLHITAGARGAADSGANAVVTVRNTGTRAGTEVVEAYLRDPASADEPPQALAAFAPVTLAPGASESVTLSVPASAFATWQGGAFAVRPGTYVVAVGTSSANLSMTAPIVRS